jgi:hypothetical protein
MLFINGVRERAELAISALRIAVGTTGISTRDEEGNLRLTEEGVNVIQRIVFSVQDPNEPDRQYNKTIRMPNMPSAVSSHSWMRTPDPVDAQIGLDWLKANRLNYITWLSYIAELRAAAIETELSFEMSVGSSMDNIELERWRFLIDRTLRHVDVLNNFEESQLYLGLMRLATLKITENGYKGGLKIYEDKIARLTGAAIVKEETGISKMFETRPASVTNSSSLKYAVRAEALELFSKMQNGLSARTWGFEIEVPDCKGVKAPNGVEKGDDGSLRSENTEDCECECDTCVYHSCNCDVCEYGSEDPEHCGDEYCASGAESAEYRSVGGIQRVLHGGMLQLCDELVEEDAEMNDSAGTHIHVYAQDLTTNQVGQVMATYHWLYKTVFTPIAGRVNNQYAAEQRVTDIGNALRKRNPVLRAWKPVVVNVSQLLGGRGTIEFRQQDCNLDGKLITVWAWLVRGLVEVAKRGAKFGDFKNASSLADIVDVFARFNYTLQSESPGLVIVGSKSDEGKYEKVTHKQIAS